MSDNIAPKGQLWVCGACGKTTRDRYGTDRGWDESCMLNAVLCHDQKKIGRNGLYEWHPVEAPAILPHDGEKP